MDILLMTIYRRDKAIIKMIDLMHIHVIVDI